jgi:hypothetical protein
MAVPKLPGELTWPKLLGTSIAAVVAAWLAGYLGLGNTLTGVAIGSVIATFGSAFFTTTIAKTHEVIPTVLVRTDRGTVIETRADHDVSVEDAGGTTVFPAQPDQPEPTSGAVTPAGPSRWSQIHWKSVAIAALLTMGVTLGAISIYENAVGRTWGSNEPGTTLGNTVRGGPAPTVAPTPTPTATEEPTEEPSPSEEPSESPTPTDQPSESPTPTPSPTPTDCPTPTGTPTDGASPGLTDAECPTPTESPSEEGGLLR